MTHGSFGMPFNLAYAYHSLDAREHVSDQASTAEAAAMTAMATSSTNYSTMHGVVSQQDRHEMFPVFPGSGGRPRIDVAHARCMLVCNHLVRFHEPDGYCSTVLL